MTTIRLKPDHPIFQALERIFQCMDDEGMRFEFNRNGDIEIRCNKTAQIYMIRDLDQGDDGRYHAGINALPPCLEYKVIYRKDD